MFIELRELEVFQVLEERNVADGSNIGLLNEPVDLFSAGSIDISLLTE